MKIKFLQHAAFENAANIESWAHKRGFDISGIRIFEGEEFCALSDFDMLVVMGGPMNIYEEETYPWLTAEKKFIESAIRSDKKIIGVCLGAQLIADVLGVEIFKNKEKEIGWFNVALTQEAEKSGVFAGFEKEFKVFQWHSDTFPIPSGARLLASSKACANQAFDYNNGNVLALQFHLETNAVSMDALIKNCADEITPGMTFVQSADDMEKDSIRYLSGIEQKITAVLDAMVL